MKKSVLFALIVFSVVSGKSYAQSISESVVSPIGGTFSIDGLEYSFTLGEAIVHEFISDEISLASGYEESDLEELVTALENKVDISANIRTYPNPVESTLNLSVENNETGDYKLVIFDVNGKIVFSQNIGRNLSTTEINLSELSRGSYLLNITSINKNTYGFVHITKL